MKRHRRMVRRRVRLDLLLGFTIGVALLARCVWLSQERPNVALAQYVETSKTENLGAVVFLAPQRTELTWWSDTSRFCFLMRAVRSVDLHLNQQYGPYPIYILVAKDHALDPRKKDGLYTEQDRALIRSWAPHSNVFFQEINLYSEDALEPDTTVEQITQWRKGEDGAIEGRDLGYQSMCRLWSGRVQTMDFLQKYTYYLRMDDDSLLTDQLPFDPFQQMLERGLEYAWRRNSFEEWGIDKLNEILNRHVEINYKTPFTSEGEYIGMEPYNNFHVSRVSFWSSPKWQAFWKDLNEEHAFFKYRLGDANVHAVTIIMIPRGKYDMWHTFPYVHNSNDMEEWGPPAWRLECEAAEQQVGIDKGQISMIYKVLSNVYNIGFMKDMPRRPMVG